MNQYQVLVDGVPMQELFSTRVAAVLVVGCAKEISPESRVEIVEVSDGQRGGWKAEDPDTAPVGP